MVIINRGSIFCKNLFRPGDDVAYYIDGKPTTFTELKKRKRERQQRELEIKLTAEYMIKPCYIWVFRNPYFPYCGWWTYVETLKKSFGINFRNPQQESDQKKLMDMLPFDLLPGENNFRYWMMEFERKFHVGSKKRKQNGMIYGWVKYDWRGIIDIKLNREDL